VGCTEVLNKNKSIKVNFCSEFNFIDWLIDKADTKVLANIFAIRLSQTIFGWLGTLKSTRTEIFQFKILLLQP